MIGEALSHYRITGRLGAGGMGEVYRAEDTRLGREVALKVLPKSMARDVTRLERFSREARAVATLNHPNIVTIHSVEEAGGTHFLTMELVDGETLDQRVVDGGLPLTDLFEIAIPLADALHCAHDKGIVHRDLKPANVMITAEGRVKVLDFGLAKLQGGDSNIAEAATVSRLLTQDGAVLGTYPYMSPEQVEGKHLDVRTDLFSFGTIVYELATGNRPFDGDSQAALMSCILRDDPAALADARPDLPRHFGRILTRCLQKDPRDRFQSARSIHNELKSLRTESTGAADDAASAVTGRGVRYERPWIAVVDFKVSGVSGELEGFAEGLAEDITAGLSRFSYLSVVNRASTVSAAAQAANAQQLSEKLRARYLIEGSVRKAGSLMRVGARLVDVRSGAHLWAETYTRSMEEFDIFSAQDDITGRVVATVADSYGVLARSLMQAIENKPDEELNPSEWLLRMFDYMMQMTPESHATLRAGLEAAVERYPRDADVWAALAQVTVNEWSFGSNTRESSLDRALTAAERAVELDRGNPFAYQMLAQAHFFRQDIPRFRPIAERAVSLNPFDTNTLGMIGLLIAHTGDFEGGAAMTRQAMDLNPNHAGWVHFGEIWFRFSRGEFERALDSASMINMPGMFWTLLVTASIFGHLGRLREGQAAIDRWLELDPDIAEDVRQKVETWHFTSGLLEPILEGLTKAGLVIPGKAAEPLTVATDAGPEAASPGPSAGPIAVQPLAEMTPAQDQTLPRSLAVLPLANLSGDQTQEFFVAGMQDALINELARIRALTVISRTSTTPFAGSTEPLPEIARKLGVEAVIEGSVLKAGDQVRINLQLVNARPERHLWADSFDGALEDILGLHSRVAQALSSAVRARLTEDEAERLSTRRKVDPDVYEIYLRAKHLSYVSAEENVRGLKYYEEVVSRDPKFAPAHAGMARNLVYLATLGAAPFQKVLPRAADAARRAVELDPDSGEARSIHGYVSLFHDWDFETAGRSLEQAREMEPNNVAVLGDSTLFLALTGAAQAAIALSERAAELDPMSATTLFWKGWAQFVAEDYAAAIETFAQSLETDPGFSYPALWTGAAHGLAGRPDQARAWARRAEALEPASRNTDFLAVLGATYVMGNRPDDARRQLSRVESLEQGELSFDTQRAYIHGWLGEYEAAAALAERAFAERNPGVIFWANHPVCDASRAHPAIMTHLEALGFPVVRPMKPWVPREG
jgi:TolB-like protein/Tfp pilus assembly protein PilF